MNNQIIEIPIEIVNIELYEMGIEEQEKTYEKLRFPARKFSGYWIDHDDMTIKFYVGASSFVTPCTSETVALFEKVMNNL
jgi:hypothetical protein